MTVKCDVIALRHLALCFYANRVGSRPYGLYELHMSDRAVTNIPPPPHTHTQISNSQNYHSDLHNLLFNFVWPWPSHKAPVNILNTNYVCHVYTLHSVCLFQLTKCSDTYCTNTKCDGFRDLCPEKWMNILKGTSKLCFGVKDGGAIGGWGREWRKDTGVLPMLTKAA